MCGSRVIANLVTHEIILWFAKRYLLGWNDVNSEKIKPLALSYTSMKASINQSPKDSIFCSNFVEAFMVDLKAYFYISYCCLENWGWFLDDAILQASPAPLWPLLWLWSVLWTTIMDIAAIIDFESNKLVWIVAYGALVLLKGSRSYLKNG